MQIGLECFMDEQISSMIASENRHGECEIQGKKECIVYDTNEDHYLEGYLEEIMDAFTVAKHLRVFETDARLLLLTLATMTVAAVVSVTGLISFVGLLAPHSARLLAGHNRRSACLLSGLLGSALLLAADTLAKTAASTELPVSIFTSLLGVPFLLYLILQPGRDAS